jgi:hypothetical protein
VDFFLVALGTAVVLATLFRAPRQPLSVTIRNGAVFFAYYLGLSVLFTVLPSEFRLAGSIAVMAGLLAVGVWWYRRHPSNADREALWLEAVASPAPIELAAVSTREWIRALIPVAVITVLVLALVVLGSRMTSPA